MLTPPEVAYVLSDCGSVGVLTSAVQLPVLRELASSIEAVRFVLGLDSNEDGQFGTLLQAEPAVDVYAAEPTGPCTVGYTSGTTGHPKGAMQSQQAVPLNCALTATMHGRTASDVVVTALPAAHVYGNVAINGTFLAGGTVVLMERFSADEALALISRHRATMFEGVPASTPCCCRRRPWTART